MEVKVMGLDLMSGVAAARKTCYASILLDRSHGGEIPMGLRRLY